MTTESRLLVADECWLALALLHHAHPNQESFSPREIMEKLRSEHLQSELRPGLPAHIHLHNVANQEPNSAKYRMFYRLGNGTLRLFRPGDFAHPARKGKLCPKREQLPDRYHYLLDWYENEYCDGSGTGNTSFAHFLAAFKGVGKELWTGIGGDAFVERQRSEWETGEMAWPDKVWERMKSHQKKIFRTRTGIPFTFTLEGENLVWFHHGDGRRIEMRTWRGELNKAIARCAQNQMNLVTDLRDLRNPSYLFGLLSDPRIRGDQ